VLVDLSHETQIHQGI